MSDTVKILLILVLAIAIIFGMPIATIWALNTLFPVVAIAYTLETWLAAFILFAGITGLNVSNRK